MNKYLLFLLFTIIVVVFALFTRSNTSKKENAGINEPKYLCDTAVEDCTNKNTLEVPKGVCIPGGKCTSG